MQYLFALFYAMAAGMCWAAGYRQRHLPRPPAPGGLFIRLWYVLSGILLVFFTDRAGGLFGAITQMFRLDAYGGGWYGTRRAWQFPAVAIALLLGLLLFFWLLFAIRQAFSRHLLIVAAIAYLTGFAGVQIISLHHVDAVLNERIGFVRVANLLDMVGLGLAISGTLLPLRERRLQMQRRSAALRGGVPNRQRW